MCAQHGWPIIDVTRRSVEESAATILKLLHDREAGNRRGARCQRWLSAQRDRAGVGEPCAAGDAGGGRRALHGAGRPTSTSRRSASPHARGGCERRSQEDRGGPRRGEGRGRERQDRRLAGHRRRPGAGARRRAAEQGAEPRCGARKLCASCAGARTSCIPRSRWPRGGKVTWAHVGNGAPDDARFLRRVPRRLSRARRRSRRPVGRRLRARRPRRAAVRARSRATTSPFWACRCCRCSPSCAQRGMHQRNEARLRHRLADRALALAAHPRLLAEAVRHRRQLHEGGGAAGGGRTASCARSRRRVLSAAT